MLITDYNVGKEEKGNKCDDVRDDVRACRYALLVRFNFSRKMSRGIRGQTHPSRPSERRELAWETFWFFVLLAFG